MMQPKPAPWLSPNVVTVKSCPKRCLPYFPSVGGMLETADFSIKLEENGLYADKGVACFAVNRLIIRSDFSG